MLREGEEERRTEADNNYRRVGQMEERKEKTITRKKERKEEKEGRKEERKKGRKEGRKKERRKWRE